MKDFMMLMDKGIDSKEASLSGMDLNAPKKGRFYAHRSRNDQEGSSDEDIGILIVSI